MSMTGCIANPRRTQTTEVRNRSCHANRSILAWTWHWATCLISFSTMATDLGFAMCPASSLDEIYTGWYLYSLKFVTNICLLMVYELLYCRKLHSGHLGDVKTIRTPHFDVNKTVVIIVTIASLWCWYYM